MKFRTGLIVGKFCPLHRGHQLLIDTALAACARLIVISYAEPGFAGYERAVRERWLRELYPAVIALVVDQAWLKSWRADGRACPWDSIPRDDAPEDEHRRFTAWLCRSVLGETVDAVFTSEDYGDGFAAALDEWFRASGAATGPVRHVCVDRMRLRVPISGTRIREDPWRWRDYLDPVVRAAFVRRVAVLGAESTGKTTLCAALADRLGTVWVPEYGRTLWMEKQGALEFADMLRIGRRQIVDEERAAQRACRWLICDTTPLTTEFYSQVLFGAVAPELAALARRRYDHVLFCLPDFTFVQDGTRHGLDFRDRQQEWLDARVRDITERTNIVAGSLADRVALAVQALAEPV